jgi:hypothetical protein
VACAELEVSAYATVVGAAASFVEGATFVEVGRDIRGVSIRGGTRGSQHAGEGGRNIHGGGLRGEGGGTRWSTLLT